MLNLDILNYALWSNWLHYELIQISDSQSEAIYFTKFCSIPSKEAHISGKKCLIATFIHFRSKTINWSFILSGFILPYSNFLKRVLLAFFNIWYTLMVYVHLRMLFYGIKYMLILESLSHLFRNIVKSLIFGATENE